MKLVKTYVADSKIPSDEEIVECIEIASKEGCIVRLEWFIPYNGKHSVDITHNMYIDDIKSKVHRHYSV